MLDGDFVRKRNEALASLDEARIRAHYREWNGGELSGDPLIFWGFVHKAITGSLSLPLGLRRASKQWLDAQGWKSFDEGDLD